MDSGTSEIDDIYVERDKILVLLARWALEQGYPVGIGIDQEKPAIWQYVLYMDLPSGQVSWHILENELEWFSFLPDYADDWDGHDRDEKYARVLRYAKNYRRYRRDSDQA
jgi:hypothetical protein